MLFGSSRFEFSLLGTTSTLPLFWLEALFCCFLTDEDLLVRCLTCLLALSDFISWDCPSSSSVFKSELSSSDELMFLLVLAAILVSFLLNWLRIEFIALFCELTVSERSFILLVRKET